MREHMDTGGPGWPYIRARDPPMRVHDDAKGACVRECAIPASIWHDSSMRAHDYAQDYVRAYEQRRTRVARYTSARPCASSCSRPRVRARRRQHRILECPLESCAPNPYRGVAAVHLGKPGEGAREAVPRGGDIDGCNVRGDAGGVIRDGAPPLARNKLLDLLLIW